MDGQAFHIDKSEIREEFVCSSGPGGQNVNKTSTAVKLSFNVRESKSLTEEQRARVSRACAGRMNAAGEIVIDARTHREQHLNRKDAFERLREMIAKALVKPRRRVKTKPTRGSKVRRLDSKSMRSTLKKGRSEKFHE